jgi:hypothetical protein
VTRIRTLVHYTNPPALAGGCLVRNGKISRFWAHNPKKRTKDAEAVGKAIFDTTINDKPMTDAELATYTPAQRTMYKEFFAAVNKSLDDLVLSEMGRMARVLKLTKYQGGDIHEAANHYADQAQNPNDAQDFLDKVNMVTQSAMMA